MRRLITILLACLGIPSVVASAQEAQFIHASPYNESRYVDVYRNGEVWLENFEFGNGTPIEPWPAETELEIRAAGSARSAAALIRRRISIGAGQIVGLVVGGDPLGRNGNPLIDIHRVDNLRKAGRFEAINEIRTVFLAHSFDGFASVRDFEVEPEMDAEIFSELGEDKFVFSYGFITPDAMAVAPFRHEADWRRGSDSSLLWSTMMDMTGILGMTWMGVLTDGAPWTGNPWENIHVRWDGTELDFAENVAPVQFVNNSPYALSASVRIRVTRIDSVAAKAAAAAAAYTHPVVLELSDVPFRTATPFLALPSGVHAGRRRSTAPELLVEVFTDSISTTPAFATRIRLRYGDDHIVVVTGDPARREDQPPMSLDLVADWWATSPTPGTTEMVFAHGIADVRAADVFRGQEPVFGSVSVGKAARVVDYPARDDTLRLTRSGSSEEIARFPTRLASSGRGDSTVVLVSSGFKNPPGSIAAAGADLGLFVVPRGGGELLPLEKLDPPGYWTKWWFWAVLLTGLAVLGFGFNQARVIRLSARQKELNLLVDERTIELIREKEKTEAQARRLTELDEAKNRFFANITHEFRTPLTLILGPVQDALDGYFGPLEPKLSSQMGVMHRSARRLLRLINQLLDLSKLESGNMTLATRLDDLAAYAEDLARGFVPLAERREIELQVEIPDEVLACRFDADAVEKVISNLLSNALKFTPDGGKVQFNVTADPETIRIAVRDNGPGIPEDDLERIFERFQQADTSIRRKFEGSGIGLTLAKELVELHGGTIGVESAEGFGTTFRVTLPRSTEPLIARSGTAVRMVDTTLLDEALLSRPVADLEAEADDVEGATVLIVEDNHDVRGYLHQHLGERYKVLEAVDGQEGLELARKFVPALVISDVMMPRMDGYELCRSIKADERLRHTPVILLTAKASEGDTIEGLERGADAYIAKPFSMKALEIRVANLIASRSEIREQLRREVPAELAITSDDEAFVNQVLERIGARLGDANLSIDSLADDLGIGRGALESRVQEATTMTPAQLVRKMRLDRASQLLRAKAGSVAEIAHAVGFRSPAHFAKVFKAAFGDSPMEGKGRRENAPLSLTGMTISHYTIGEKVGAGGMGVVYRARDVILDREVAIKVLPARWTADEEANARFMQEAKAVSALDHPNLCAIYDIGETEDGAMFMVMPFYKGETVGAMINAGGISAEQTVSIATDVADGLASAHARGVVHRDIKPDNILVTEDGVPKVLDFGVAKLSEEMSLTVPGSTVGTAAYMSPEQLRGEPAGPRSDLWSLGVVLYEMLAGSAPFDGEYVAARSYQILNETHRAIAADVPAEVRDLIDRLLQKEPDDRPADAGEVVQALRRVYSDAVVS